MKLTIICGDIDSKCNTCAYARWDYEEYYGGFKRWFFDRCEYDLEEGREACKKYERYEDVGID